MDQEDFAGRVADIAALADPTRRELYRYVVAQGDPVSRDRAAQGVGVPRHTAKFHLDKLVEQGLLDTSFRRLTARRGPGAGRPTKLYRRSVRQVSVTLPERRYELAGEVLAQAIDESARDGTSAMTAVRAAARRTGAEIGETAVQDRTTGQDRPLRIGAMLDALTAQGYEPRQGETVVTLANCPFDALARGHPELVCGMNLSLIRGLVDSLGDGGIAPRLDPGQDRCCVVLDIDDRADQPDSQLGQPEV